MAKSFNQEVLGEAVQTIRAFSLNHEETKIFIEGGTKVYTYIVKKDDPYRKRYNEQVTTKWTPPEGDK